MAKRGKGKGRKSPKKGGSGKPEAPSARPSGKGSSGGNGGNGPRYLREKLSELEKEILAFMKGASADHRELTANQDALEVLGLYVSEKRTSYSSADTNVLGPENFRDKTTDYVPMAKAIAKAYRDLEKADEKVSDAREAAKEARADADEYKREKSEAEQKYRTAESERKAAAKRVGELEKQVEEAKKHNVEELEKAKQEYDKLRFSVERIALLKGRYYNKLDAAAREGEGSDAYKWVIDFTLFPVEGQEKERTPATKWLEVEGMRNMQHPDRLIKLLRDKAVELEYSNPAE